MDYKKQGSRSSKAEPRFDIMEQYQAGQLDTLVEVNVEDRTELAPRPTASPACPHHCLKCTVAMATLMGLVIVGLLMGILLNGLIYKSPCKQDLGPPGDTKKVNTTLKLKAGTQEEEYYIFTAPKDAIYFIYGQVKRLDRTSTGPIYLEHRWGKTTETIQVKNGSCPEIFFSTEVKLFKDSGIYLVFNEGQPNYKNTFFHIYEF